MSNRLLLDPDGSAILVEPGSYLLYEPEFAILVPDRQKIHVFPQNRTFNVAPREGIWVPPKNPLGGS